MKPTLHKHVSDMANAGNLSISEVVEDAVARYLEVHALGGIQPRQGIVREKQPQGGPNGSLVHFHQ